MLISLSITVTSVRKLYANVSDYFYAYDQNPIDCVLIHGADKTVSSSAMEKRGTTESEVI